MYEQRHGIQIMKNQREHFRKRTCTHPTVRCSVSKMRSDKHNYQRKCVFSGDARDIMQGSLDCVLWFRQGGRWPNFFNLGEANRFFRSSSYVFRHLFLSSKANIWMTRLAVRLGHPGRLYLASLCSIRATGLHVSIRSSSRRTVL